MNSQSTPSEYSGPTSPSSSSSRAFQKASNTNTTRRTRHRVDAGEPRGTCFNSPPTTIQQSALTQQQQQQQQQQFQLQQFHHLHQQQYLHQQQALAVNQRLQHYPMKMLQDFISPSQLLLRDMLQKKQGYEDECNNNNSNGRESNSNGQQDGQLPLRINGCKKRKRYQPQKTDLDSGEMNELDEDEFDEDDREPSLPREISAASTAAPLTRQLLTERHSPQQNNTNHHNHYHHHHNNNSHNNNNNLAPLSPPFFLNQWKDNFKTQLITNVSELVDKHFEILFPKSTQQLLTSQRSSSITPPPSREHREHNNNNHHNNNNNNSNAPTKQEHHHHQQVQISRSITPSLIRDGNIEHPNVSKMFNGGTVETSYGHNFRFTPKTDFSAALANLAQHRELEIGPGGDQPLSLVMTPKKKRHKLPNEQVTDTRLTPRAVSKLLSDYPPSPCSSPQLPTTVAIPNPSLPLFPPYSLPLFPGSRSDRDRDRERDRDTGTRGSSPDFQPPSSDSGETNSFDYTLGHSSTLTPMHLRKAKLMFFWVRYPSSSVLKMYFPDIRFNKNNTAQLVKWFSNFREFYYIQMEKYARQALSEGVKNSEDMHVSLESELYRVLNLHYNRNNHIEVPTNFRYVVEQTLREFFKSIQTGKDSEQSWKKAIYKIIARLDDPVPDYFKSPNFLEQLE